MNKCLRIDEIDVESSTQNRSELDDDVVEVYRDMIVESSSWPFPPIVVFDDDGHIMCADGFHRIEAARLACLEDIPVSIRKGSAEDAKLYGMTANDKHGLRMTRDDKRKCVEWVLEHRKGLTQSQIAQIAGVSRRTVQVVVAKRSNKLPVSPPSEPTASPPSDGGGEGANCAIQKKGHDDPAITIKEPSSAWRAREVLVMWRDTVKRWLNRPPSMHDLAEEHSCPEASEAIERTLALINTLQEWSDCLDRRIWKP